MALERDADAVHFTPTRPTGCIEGVANTPYAACISASGAPRFAVILTRSNRGRRRFVRRVRGVPRLVRGHRPRDRPPVRVAADPPEHLELADRSRLFDRLARGVLSRAALLRARRERVLRRHERVWLVVLAAR